MRSVLAVLCLLALAAGARAAPAEALAEAQKLIQHARASARHGNAARTIEKVEQAVDILERELRATHPVGSPQVRALAGAYRRGNEKLFEAYRSQGRGADARRRLDAVLETLEGLIARSHSYATDVFTELGAFYHEVLGQLARAAARDGDRARLDATVDRFLDTLEGLLAGEHAGNRQWQAALTRTYAETVRQVAGHYAARGRSRRVLALVTRARATLAGVLGEDHEAVRTLAAKQAELEGR